MWVCWGYAGWAPYQLDGEIRAGNSWIICDGEAELLFQRPYQMRYLWNVLLAERYSGQRHRD